MDNQVKPRRAPIAAAISAISPSSGVTPQSLVDQQIGELRTEGAGPAATRNVGTHRPYPIEQAEAAPTLRVVTIKRLVTLPPYSDLFTESAFRNLVHDAEDRFNSRGERTPGNRLLQCGAVFRIGRRVLIDLDALDAWLLSHASNRSFEQHSS